MNDEELVQLAQSGDKSAQEQLLLRYKKTVLSIARRFFLTGGDTEDLVQEGMCGLYSAINSYTPGKSAFTTYAHTCIRNRILDAVGASQNLKNAPLNNSVPILEVAEDFVATSTPEDELIMRENRREFLQKISGYLSPMEFQVIVMYMDGLTVSEIAVALRKPNKSVDNALQRAKHKLQKSYRE